MSIIYLREGTLVKNRYRVNGVIGQGGFGIVYDAWDRLLDVPVAIKEFYANKLSARGEDTKSVILRVEKERDEYELAQKRFLAEARHLAQLNKHPNVLNVYEYFTENDTVYIVMQRLHGRTLEADLRERGRMSWKEATRIIKAVAEGLAVLHLHKIIHRDISPDNIFLGDDGSIQLIDFGNALFEDEQIEPTEIILKFAFAPPEQYKKGQEQGEWTDIYALATTLYVMTTGVVPPSAIERQSKDEIIPPHLLNKAILESNSDVLMQAMSIAPQERFQSVLQFIKALDAKKTKIVRLILISGMLVVFGMGIAIASIGGKYIDALSLLESSEKNSDEITTQQVIKSTKGSTQTECISRTEEVSTEEESIEESGSINETEELPSESIIPITPSIIETTKPIEIATRIPEKTTTKATTKATTTAPQNEKIERPIYDVRDIAIINRIIEQNPQLGLEKAPVDGSSLPASWESKGGPVQNHVEFGSFDDMTYKDSQRMVILWLDDIKGELDLTGLDALSELHVDGMTSLTISKNPCLQSLSIDSDQLATLDIRNNPNLEKIRLSNVPITSIDLSKNLKLKEFSARDSKLETLDVSHNKELQRLVVNGNSIKNLNLSNHRKLTELDISNTLIMNIDLSQQTNLVSFSLYGNQISKFNIVSAQLKYLSCGNTPIEKLDLSGFPKLMSLSCDVTNLTELDVSKNKELEEINCMGTFIKKLDLSNNPLISQVLCDENVEVIYGEGVGK